MEPRAQVEPRVGRKPNIQKPKGFSVEQQTERFGPKFDRLRDTLARDPQGLSLRADPGSLAPERMLVFELRGSVEAFASAVAKVPGLEFIDEESLTGDETDTDPIAYLLVPDMAALRQIESLWRQWNAGSQLARGFAAWRDVFTLLRDLRPWGPEDRVDKRDAATLEREIEGRDARELLRLEVEVVFRASDEAAQLAEAGIAAEIARARGTLVSRARLKEIGYHAMLVDLPVSEVQAIIDHRGVSTVENVMHIRPQSISTTIETGDTEPLSDTPDVGTLGRPILALFDGVPVGNHPLLAQHVSVDDLFGLESVTAVADRKHGTAMASLIVHGDRNRRELPLPRKIHVLPVLTAEAGHDETFRSDRLIVDIIYQAVRSMREGADASAPEVLIVNLSVGNPRQPFHRPLSAWAKLLDRLAYQYGILFVVSAGNVPDAFDVKDFGTRTAFEDADPGSRAQAVLGAVGTLMAQRRLISPAETVNGVTVGAHSHDDIPSTHREAPQATVEAYSGIAMANPSSALGPGYGGATKPDILMPGSRERLSVLGNMGGVLKVRPATPSRASGLRVAAPPKGFDEHFEYFTSGTSAAAALASRTCHQIHDALEAAYGDSFLSLSHRRRAVLVKALLAHTARWPKVAASMIRQILGPTDGKHHVRQKDNIRRVLGYGIVDAESATACAGDRATFWATGEIAENQVVQVPIPVPIAMASKSLPHSLSATAAWFTPTKPGNRRYRAVRLKLLKPDALGSLGLEESFPDQPDHNQVNRGTLYHQQWVGAKAAAIPDNLEIALRLQREPDQAGMVVDDPVPFAVAVTLAMPGVIEIYEQVRQRLEIPVSAT